MLVLSKSEIKIVKCSLSDSFGLTDLNFALLITKYPPCRNASMIVIMQLWNYVAYNRILGTLKIELVFRNTLDQYDKTYKTSLMLDWYFLWLGYHIITIVLILNSLDANLQQQLNNSDNLVVYNYATIFIHRIISWRQKSQRLDLDLFP